MAVSRLVRKIRQNHDRIGCAIVLLTVLVALFFHAFQLRHVFLCIGTLMVGVTAAGFDSDKHASADPMRCHIDRGCVLLGLAFVALIFIQGS